MVGFFTDKVIEGGGELLFQLFYTCTYYSTAVFRIHMFLGLPDPDPLVTGMDPNPPLDLDPDPSIIKQKL